MPSRRVSVLVAAALLFAGVFMLGIADPSADDLVSFLYALPVALIAVELGLAWGITAAVLALGLFGLWDATDHTFNGNLVGYASLGATFLVLGGAVGALDRAALCGRIRRLLQAPEWRLGADARLDAAGAVLEAIHRVHPPRRPRGDQVRGGGTERCRPRNA